LLDLLDIRKVVCVGQNCFQTVTTNFRHLCSTLHLTGAPQTPIKPMICKLYILSLHRMVILQWLLLFGYFSLFFGGCNFNILWSVLWLLSQCGKAIRPPMQICVATPLILFRNLAQFKLHVSRTQITLSHLCLFGLNSLNLIDYPG